MTARAEAEKAITAVLSEHRDETEDVLQDCHCTCGTKICPNGGGMSHNWHFRAHVASVLADLITDGPTLADAWDEGWNECVDHRNCTYTGPGECPDAPPNPYRVADTEGDR